MRILFITASYLPDSVGGVELHIAGLVRALGAAGHQCTVVCRNGAGSAAHLSVTRDRHEGADVVRIGNTFEDATSLRSLYAHEGLAEIVMGVVEEVAPDVCHVHHLTCLSTAILDGLAQRGVPTVMTLHDFWMGCPRGQRITAALDVCPEVNLDKCVPCLRELWPHLLGPGCAPESSTEEQLSRDRALLDDYHSHILSSLNRVDVLVTPSAFMARKFEEYGLPQGSVAVVENGLPTADYAGARRPSAGAPLRIGFIGSVLPSKGVHLLLEAFRQLGGDGDVRLDVWGEVLPFHNDRNYGERLQALCEGFEASITLRGAYDNSQLPAILATLDVVVVPSLWYEAFCLTIREAFLAGAAVITANHGAMAEAVEDGVTGLLFEPGDVGSLTAALRRMIDDSNLRQRLSQCAAPVRDELQCAHELMGIYTRLSGTLQETNG
ncbi:MAG: glycosyltransferase involved in cell wall biosynthesis [Pseudohongiellaceae bacterium]|jgi:glycosyltransferase involved in cell wall biosynthesis